MIIPIGDENVIGGAKPIFSYSFIGLNILVFLFQFSSGSIEAIIAFAHTFGAIPAEILRGEDLFTLATNIFLHGDLMHLAFVFFYFLGGLVATLCHVYITTTPDLPSVGASGAISAVMGAYMVCFPKSKIRLLVIFLFRSFYIPAFIILSIWMGQQVFSVFTIAEDPKGGVAWWAHIGGFAFGVVYALLFFKKNPKAEYNYV